MYNTIKKITALGLVITLFAACSKEQEPLDDRRPTASAVIVNAIDYRPDPTIKTTLAPTDSIITITFSTGNSTNRIKEVTKIAASTSYAQIQSTGSTGFYTLGSVTGIGTNTVTFTTTLRQYYTVHPLNATNPAPAVNTELARRFYFLLTFLDGQTAITPPVRVLVLAP